jgi:hypothetical protein
LAAIQEKTGISPTELRPDLARHFPAQPEQARASWPAKYPYWSLQPFSSWRLGYS